MSIASILAQAAPYYPTTNMSEPEATATLKVMAFVIAFTVACVIGAYILNSVLLSRIFKKIGVESWKAWVPIYNNWILLELGGQRGFWAALALIPIVNIASSIFMIIAMYRIGLNFGKEGAFVLLAIFMPLIWFIWLAFDSSTWKSPSASANKSFFPKSTPPSTVK